jgi:Cu2+-containing amine oxidase
MIAVEDTYMMERDEKNPHGVGFEVFNKVIEKESAFDLDWTTNRSVKIVRPLIEAILRSFTDACDTQINPNKLNRFSKKPVAYKVGLHPTQLGLAHPTSMHHRRGEFCDNHVHVTKYASNEMFAAGEHPWQSVGGQGGCRTWASRGRDVEKGESVLWLTFGFTHATKSEGE